MKILIASSIDPAAIAEMEQEHDVVSAFGADEDRLTELVRDREVVVFRSGVHLTERVLEAGFELRLVLRAGSGLDNVDVPAATRRGIEVVRVPGSSAQPVAEFTFALLLGVARNVALADRLLRGGHWPKPELGGPLLSGKTLGIVGAGRIGGRVGEMGAAWGMRVLGCVGDPNPPGVGASLADRGITLTDLDTIVSESDFLCLHVPLDDRTRHMVGAPLLAKMKPGSFLVNVARGGVVDEAALYDALREGTTLAGAALDVHEREGEGTRTRFADLRNVVLTPHIGAMALDSQRLIGERILELLAAQQRDDLATRLTTDEIVNQNDTTGGRH